MNSLQQQIVCVNWLDDEGRPAGGSVTACGLSIQWQNGPLVSGEDRIAPNGAFVETVLTAALQRLQHYQDGKFNCRERVCDHEAGRGSSLAQRQDLPPIG